jgi:hypothetical protein
MRIEKYNQEHQSLWDEFIKNSKNGNIFHTRKFLSYHPEDRFNDKSILIFDKNNIKAVFPAVEFENGIISHRGSTYGGLIVSNKNRISDSLNYFELILDYYKEFDYIKYRKCEYIFDKFPSQEVEFAAKKSGFLVDNEELSTCLDLSSVNFSKLRKRGIGKCKNLKIVGDDSNYTGFFEILSKNLERHDATSTHSLDEMLKLNSIFPNNYILFSIYLGDKIVAGIWLVKTTSNTAHTFYIAQDYDFIEYHSLTCLVKYIIDYLKDNKFKYLNFGISTEDAGNIINKGLFEFKESFGGFGVSRLMYKKGLK